MTEENYRKFQNKLASSQPFRYFWQFWGNYAFTFFVIACLIVLTQSELATVIKPLLWISILSFLIARGIVVFNINLFYERQRPYQKFNFSPITSKFFSWKTSTPNSFPSRHTVAYFSVAVVFAFFVPALGAALIGVGTLAGVARIILGYHWPSDILVGAIIGSVVAVLCVYFGYPIIFT